MIYDVACTAILQFFTKHTRICVVYITLCCRLFFFNSCSMYTCVV